MKARDGFLNFNMIGRSVSRPVMWEDQRHAQIVSLRIRSQINNSDVYLDIKIIGDRVAPVMAKVGRDTLMYLAGTLEHTPRQMLTSDPSAISLRGVITNNDQLIIFEHDGVNDD